ncbi:VanZ family protein [Lipingzhangella sp. LS1_29]|uniref:VanZ family protein n=1 Tax=Lipingzhangella rawalii TaxID=2055835 RepID=A0ABU2HAB5_9ACTN|nr:VanZ family protein [Lipingzhangella rawalii]MDS1272193.1 VanZ family protein [Lipingzhangella rawalii]
MGWGIERVLPLAIPGTAGTEALVISSASLVVVVASALFLYRQHRVFGWLGGWPGLITLATVATGWLVALAALWPLPTGQLCTGGGSAAQPQPGATLTPLTTDALLRAGITAAVFLPVGALAWYRYRQGLLRTVGLAVAVAGAVELVQLTGVFGAYPCAYRVAATDDVLAGGLGALIGWLAARPLTTRVLRRGWPAGMPDLMRPSGLRRQLALLLDLALWWLTAAVITGALVRAGAVHPLAGPTAFDLVLVGLAVLMAGVVPLLSPLRQTLGRMVFALGLGMATGTGPASRWRVLLRSVLVHGPVVTLFVLGLPWWALLVVAVHGAPAVARRDQRGLADLLCGTRVVTSTILRGGLPPRMTRYHAPRVPHTVEATP